MFAYWLMPLGRYRQCQTTRAHTQKEALLDHQALQRGLRQQSSSDRAIVRYVASGAAWTQGQISSIAPDQKPLCRLCGQPEQDIEHGLWHCVPVQEAAKKI